MRVHPQVRVASAFVVLVSGVMLMSAQAIDILAPAQGRKMRVTLFFLANNCEKFSIVVVAVYLARHFIIVIVMGMLTIVIVLGMLIVMIVFGVLIVMIVLGVLIVMIVLGMLIVMIVLGVLIVMIVFGVLIVMIVLGVLIIVIVFMVFVNHSSAEGTDSDAC
jgi:hypothetical protein